MSSADLPQPLRLCLADDDPTSRLMLRVLLRKWGYEVEECCDGCEAFTSLVRDDGPRLAVLDWMMPGMDGAQISRRLREEFPCRQYYLILLTARAEAEYVLPGLRSGADDFISKPFTTAVLQARLEVGFRTLALQSTIAGYAARMQELAETRAVQLVHSDRLATLGTLSASVAHEINNPASFLSVNVQTLEEMWPAVEACVNGQAQERQLEQARALCREMPSMLREMKDGLERIRRITGELRNFSRSDTGRAEPIGPVELGVSLHRALRMCSLRLKGKVEVEVEGDESVRVLADAPRLEQVVVNLVMNAADAMEGCERRCLRIGILTLGGICRLGFQDTGPGVPPALAERIFLPFQSTKSAGQGTGLGLYISRNLVEEFGGTLMLESVEGAGACFVLTLNCAKDGEA